MPNAPPHPCPGCGRLVGREGCATCRKAKQAPYNQAWAAFSKAWLRRFPWCGQRQDGLFYAEHSRCVQRGERVRAQVTDHLIALVDGGAHLSEDNSQSLCIACNTAKRYAR